jgi:hypothetical protein
MKYEIKSLKTGGKAPYQNFADKKLKGKSKKDPKAKFIKKDQAGAKVKPVLLKGPTVTSPKPNYATSEPIKSKTDLDYNNNFKNTGNYKTVIPKKSKTLASKKHGGVLDISNILAK